ncbi:alanine racemase [Streptococcus oralis subsp. dentisani]|uniref:Alanine racemase n=1 Tax=Streptococcus oralis subsp. dentisani TaxID=1458253 RepID=A0A1X1J6A1_STROR|nr:alanine racemase [Streptococcus oralis subsp. dentisani]
MGLILESSKRNEDFLMTIKVTYQKKFQTVKQEKGASTY